MCHCVRGVAFCTAPPSQLRPPTASPRRLATGCPPAVSTPFVILQPTTQVDNVTQCNAPLDPVPWCPTPMSKRPFSSPLARLALPLATAAMVLAQFLWTGCGVGPGSSSKSQVALTTAQSLEGQPVDPLSSITHRAVVLFFLSTECPISNKYAPEIRRLVSKYRPMDIEFYAVYPNPDERPDTIARHLREFDLNPIPLRDPDHHLVVHAKATVTPEAVVFLPNRQIAYRGRINDKFPRLGIERPEASHQDLAKVLEAITSSSPIPTTGGPAIGCYIAPLPPPSKAPPQ